MLSSIKRHYHWVIAVVMLLELAVIGGISNNYNGLFILPITTELEISRASFSLAYTLKYLFSFATTLFSGVLILRFGNKKPLVAGLFFCGAGYALLPMSTSTALLAAGNVLLGIGEALCCTAAVSRIISVWFHRYQGLVWGAVSASTGIGGSILCVLLSGIIQSQGWRMAYLFAAVIVAVTVVLVLIFVKSRPEEMQLSPYGIGYAPKKKQSRSDDHWPGYTKEQLWHQPVFYLALICVFSVSLSIYLAYNNIVPHLQGQGLTQSEAVAQQSAMLIYLTVSKFLAGMLSDWIGPKAVSIICSILAAISLFLLSRVMPGANATVTIFLYALALPMTTVMVPLLASSLLGYRAQSTYHGIFMSMPTLGILIASPVSNAVFDRAGSYTPALQFAAVLAAASTVLLAINGILANRKRKRA